MFTHIVFFKLKDPTRENIKFVEEALLSMNGKIEELKKLEVGVDVIRSERSFDIGIITRFDSKEDCLTYDINEYHVEKVKKVIGPYVECSKSLDF